jgi:DNA-directed RNA polymerase subunit RPC12/RpoP
VSRILIRPPAVELERKVSSTLDCSNMALPDSLHFTIQFQTREGFLSRQCNADECGRIFKVHKDDIRADMHCAYCGLAFPDDELWTDEQQEYIRKSALHQAQPILEAEIEQMFRKAFSGPGWTFKPGPQSTPRSAPTPPAEKATDSELQCPQCGVRFQVEGIFGFCPGCRAENLRLYDANLAIIRHEVLASDNPTRALRHAYADLVSMFEIFCRKEAADRGIGAARFQNVAATRKFFADKLGVDLQASLSAAEFLAVRRTFQKRHVLGHNDGAVDQGYIAEVPEDGPLLGQKVSVTLVELELAATGVRRMLEALVASR